MIDITIVALLACAALYYVISPLRRPVRLQPPDPAVAIEARKRGALEAILDLEAEVDAGKLSASDFERLRSEYEAEAVGAIRELGLVETAEADDPLEFEIATVRTRLTCPSCGAPRSDTGRCAACGA